MSEAALWDRVSNGLKAAGYSSTRRRAIRRHIVRIENGVGDGYPDVGYCFNGRSGHIELKYRPDLPARKNTALFTSRGLRDSQILWAYHRCKAGGTVYVLAQAEHHVVMHLLTAGNVQAYNRLTLDAWLDSAAWSLLDGYTALFDLLAGV